MTTIGHGTLSADAFGTLVASAGIEVVADVRRYPGSRRHPHFGAAEMATWLPRHGIGYEPMTALGGRRKAGDDATNAAWRNPQFRAYADYMGTEEFRAAVDELLALADARRSAVMCSESLWWRCHRRLLADHLELIARVPVEHLFHDGRQVRHPPTTGHRVDGRGLTYPSDETDGG